VTKDQILITVQEVFREVFRDPALKITMNTTANDIVEWDSLVHMHLIAAIEERFKCEFSFNEVMNFEKAGDMIDKLAEKLS
jgi:acyl carrier protein